MKKVELISTAKLTRGFYIFLMLLLSTVGGFSQNVGINATGNPPNANAGLDVDFASKGLLIPRVALTGTTSFAPLAAHVAGMIVYNTATTGDVTPGFYYNNGTRWIASIPAGTAAGDMLYWNGSAWVRVPAGTPGQFLQFSPASIPVWTGSAFIDLTTTAVTSIAATTATSGGTIVNANGTTILTRGVCFATTTNPTTGNTTVAGTAVSPFTCNLTGLTAGTIYYIRAYATNSSVVSYGNQLTFSTLPTLTTTAASLITTTTARTGGNVTTGNAPVIERGVCYGTTSNPTTASTKVIDPSPGAGAFISDLTGLVENTLYYVRSYAINAGGTAYGTQITLTTLSTLTTTAITSITQTSASGGGTIAVGGGASISVRGVCWSTSPNPTTALATKTNNGTGAGVFTSSITGLAGSTLYYVRAYATNAGGISYGVELSFTTASPVAPVITSTNAITNLSANTATTGGAISSDGGAAITVKGVCWSTSPNPVLGIGNFTSNGTGTASFVSNITGLTGSTLYYTRAYATNSAGTGYGPVDVSFTTWVQAAYSVGQNLGYGYCCYVNSLGGGLIVSYDIPSTTGWGCPGTIIGTGTAIGTGQSNTNLILAACVTRPIAASIADDYSITYNGVTYSDWYLPSSAEWATIATPYNAYGLGYAPCNFYTSSEYGSNTYATTYFNNGSQAYQSGAQRVPGVNDYIKALRVMRTFNPPALPAVTTEPAVTNIGGTTATSGGNVTSEGGATVSARGVCWSTVTGPTIANPKTTDGTGAGVFVSSITGLTQGTTYFVRAYATNIAGTSYGLEVSFTTAAPATLTTDAVTNIAATTATSGGNITNDGGTAVTARGVCWSTVTSPTISDPKTSDGTGTGTFVSSITGLTTGVPYFVRAYATTGFGTVYGNEQTFTPAGAGIPTVTTDPVTSPTSTGGTSGGNVTSDGGAAVTARGVCWNSTGTPAITDPKTTDGTGTGTFVSTISGLTTGVLYYIRAYATNSVGTAYGAEELFAPGIAVITTDPVTNPTSTGGTSGGNITTDGGSAITARGVCWNTGGTPTIADTKTSDGTGAGTFVSTITGLTAGTGYWIRAYATNANSTSYGQEEYYMPVGPPTPVTGSLTYNTGDSFATLGVMSTNWGGGTLSAYGVVWGTTTNPTVASHAGITTEDIALYYFFQNSLITPINPDGSVTYYIRTYATNEIGTAYGTEIVLTPGVLAVPVVETTPILNLIGSIAEGGGNVISDGGDPIITAGICWGLTADPTVGSHLGITTDGFTGQFYSLLSGLTLGTTYHFRAYATNSTGTSYGADLSLVATAATLGQMTSGGNLWGTVFSVDGTGLHGLITQSWAYGIDTDWGCANTTVGTSTSMGTGSANTIAINLDVLANSCPTTSTWGANAPYYAATGFGPDWYLPSKDELNLLYTTRIATGMDGAFSSATPTTTFWSSSEVNATNAWYFDYVTGTWVSGLKTSLQNFFAIRSF